MEQMAIAPAELMHPAHCHQLLKPTMADWTCDICEVDGNGWLYNCQECDWGAHPECVGAILDTKGTVT